MFDFEIKIWEAARATLAASTSFEPVTIGPYGEVFVDGSLGANNPIRALWSEMLDIWDTGSKLSCLLSVGTGVTPLQPRVGGGYANLIRSVIAIAAETEQTASSFAGEHRALVSDGKYFRLNVQQGLEGVSLEEFEKLEHIATATELYLRTAEVRAIVLQCAKVLAQGDDPLPEEQASIPPIVHQPSFEVDPLGLTVIPPQDDHATVEVE